jgi:hypothetical protein
VTPFRSELAFASLVTYCPRGDGDEIRRSQTLMRQLKSNRMLRHESAAAFVSRRLREMSPSEIVPFLSREVALLPVPRSSFQKPGALWPAFEIANALLDAGFGSRVVQVLCRRSAVDKAAIASPKDRPSARIHFDSLEVVAPMDLPASVTLIDDVITRGAQMLGAAWRIWSVRPDVVVRGFAVIRTISRPEDFSAIAAPCSGRVTLGSDGNCRRTP